MPDPPGWPPDEDTIQMIHARYQRDVIEAFGLCPFARRSRELGRVHRPVHVVTEDHEPTAAEVVGALGRLVDEDRDAEIILLTFPIPPGHRWWQPVVFDRFLGELREAWAELPPPREFYLVSFHPDLGPPPGRPLNSDSLVSIIRRSPDPVIQCVDADLLDRIRRQAQVGARERMLRTLEEQDPELAALFAQSVSSDPELSSEIARTNFQCHGRGEALSQLETTLAELRAARDQAYGLVGGDAD